LHIPIEIPNADQSLGDLRNLLGCGLEMHFGIGDLDFQASREGLSYIPQTVESIKTKLLEVNAALAVVIAKEADAIPNLWDRAVHLHKKYNNSLWTTAIKKYVADTKLPTFDDSRYGGTMTFKVSLMTLLTNTTLLFEDLTILNIVKHILIVSLILVILISLGGGYDIFQYWGLL
jgi:hypothetical protein